MGRMRFAHIRRLCGLVLVPLMLTALLAPPGAATAASKPPRCRGAGMPADAPLFYLELMPYDDAEKARELESLKYDEERKEREPGRKQTKKGASGQSGEAARLAAGIRRVGTPGARIGVEEAKERWKELEIIAVLPFDPEQLTAAHEKREDWPRQQQLESAYHGETRNIVPRDLNHDGIMDFSFNEDPLLNLWASQLFLGCGDNFYTPLGFFIAGYSSASGPAVTVKQRSVNGRSWDAFHVVAPDLPTGMEGSCESGKPLRHWAERVIAFDPARGVYREISVKPLP